MTTTMTSDDRRKWKQTWRINVTNKHVCAGQLSSSRTRRVNARNRINCSATLNDLQLAAGPDKTCHSPSSPTIRFTRRDATQRMNDMIARWTFDSVVRGNRLGLWNWRRYTSCLQRQWSTALPYWQTASIFMAALRSRCGHHIFAPWFLSSSSFSPRLISAVADWMSTILPHMMWP